MSLITTIGLDLHNQCIPEKIKMYYYTLTSAKENPLSHFSLIFFSLTSLLFGIWLWL